MTISGDFMPSDGRELDSGSAYPTVFGISFTPTVSGALIAILGVGGAVFLLLNQVQPAWDNYQSLQAEVEQKQTEIAQQGDAKKKLADAQKNLQQAEAQRTEVYALFADERDLNTLLLDLNRLVNARQARLVSFTPAPGAPTLIADSSLGPEVNGKLKRKEITVNLEGTYEQTQSIMRSIERLQPLMLVQNYNSQLDRASQKVTVNQQGRVVPPTRPETNLKTSFKLQALVPASAATPAKPPGQ